MISYQLYSSRNFGAPKAIMARLSEAGYDAVEGYGALFSDTEMRAEIAEGLKMYGLKMPTAHVSLTQLEADATFAEVLAIMGVNRVYVPYIAPEERPTDTESWTAFGRRLEQAGETVRAAGLGFGWHNHDFEFVPLPDGTVPMTHLLSANLEWQFDVAWAVRAGIDPMQWIARFGERITSVHVKDIAAKGEAAAEDGWADPGKGVMDWPALTAALAKSGTVKHWVMEHDNPSDDMRFAGNALDYGMSDPSIGEGASA